MIRATTISILLKKLLASFKNLQVVLPQQRDVIFVRSVVSGAVVNLIANACLIPAWKSMGAVAGTLLAEGTVPLVQYLILRRDLPYRQYIR